MATDVLIVNTAVLDLRSADFAFADRLAGAGGLAKCATLCVRLASGECDVLSGQYMDVREDLDEKLRKRKSAPRSGA